MTFPRKLGQATCRAHTPVIFYKSNSDAPRFARTMRARATSQGPAKLSKSLSRDQVKPNASAEYEVGQDIVLSKPPLFDHGPPDHTREMCPSSADKSPGRQAKPQLLAVWWLLKQITAPGPRPRSSTNDLAPPRRMGWVSLQPYRSRLVGGRKRAAVAVALPPRAPRTVGPRVSLPPEAGALKESSHVWAGFWLRGVQP